MPCGLRNYNSPGTRDIKPANVLFTRENVPRLADFGIGKTFGILATPLTERGDILGTLKYTAPEIIQCGISPDDTFDSRLDVYSLGATFYFMLTQVYPFDFQPGATTTEILVHVASRETVPISARNMGSVIPQSLATVIDKACSKDPARRFPDAVEFQKAFRKAV